MIYICKKCLHKNILSVFDNLRDIRLHIKKKHKKWLIASSYHYMTDIITIRNKEETENK